MDEANDEEIWFGMPLLGKTFKIKFNLIWDLIIVITTTTNIIIIEE